MRYPRNLLACCLAAALAACGGDEGDSPRSGTAACDFFLGNASYRSTYSPAEECSGCSQNEPNLIIDRNLGTATFMQTPAGQYQSQSQSHHIRAQTGVIFPAGSKPGFFISRHGGASPSTITFGTTLNGVAVQTGYSGSGLSFEPAGNGTGALEYVYLTASQAFDGITIEVVADRNAKAMHHEIYEACSDGRAR